MAAYAPIASTSREPASDSDEDDLAMALPPRRGDAAGAGTSRSSADGPRASHDEDETDDVETALLSNGSSRPPARPRAPSFSRFSFDGFGHSLMAIPISEEKRASGEERSLTLWGGIALVIGVQVGSGIFSSPGVIINDTNSVGAALLVWAGSGFLAWTGASSFAELGAAIPLDGGASCRA